MNSETEDRISKICKKYSIDKDQVIAIAVDRLYRSAMNDTADLDNIPPYFEGDCTCKPSYDPYFHSVWITGSDDCPVHK